MRRQATTCGERQRMPLEDAQADSDIGVRRNDEFRNHAGVSARTPTRAISACSNSPQRPDVSGGRIGVTAVMGGMLSVLARVTTGRRDSPCDCLHDHRGSQQDNRESPPSPHGKSIPRNRIRRSDSRSRVCFFLARDLIDKRVVGTVANYGVLDAMSGDMPGPVRNHRRRACVRRT